MTPLHSDIGSQCASVHTAECKRPVRSVNRIANGRIRALLPGSAALRPQKCPFADWAGGFSKSFFSDHVSAASMPRSDQGQCADTPIANLSVQETERGPHFNTGGAPAHIKPKTFIIAASVPYVLTTRNFETAGIWIATITMMIPYCARFAYVS